MRLLGHFHWQNLNDKPARRQGWGARNGRAWWRFGETLTLAWEWSFFKRGSTAAGVSVNDMCGEHVLSFHLCLSFLFRFYLNVDFWPLTRWRYWPKDDREIDLSIHSGSLWWSFWTPTMEWSSKTSKWRRGSFSPIDAIFGSWKHTSRVLEEAEFVVPMPEKAYPCTVQIFESTWKRPRWPWPRRRMVRANVEMKEGEQIPIPGKGENSWDCGEDATFSLTLPAKTTAEAVAGMVGSCLERRAKYAGIGYVPEGQRAK